MAANDPTMDVATPTGVLQGVAAFSWDGSAWQPTGRAGPSVATPTGVLQGVAAFNGGTPTWQPSGQSGPGVATPTGVLDGVAVHTWSGSAWVPPSGPSTPSGVLRDVAAFNWDGAAWQPAAQAGPSVATPYGVLAGVAMFNWSGSAWTAGAPSLSLDFMTPGTLPANVTFTRASTGTYFDINGVMQTAATNAPRWDYAPVTHVLNGLLIEEARTNLLFQSADVSNAAWVKSNNIVAAPTVTANQTTAPDGTLTAARVAFPAVSGANAICTVNQTKTATAAVYTLSVWLKGAVGGEQVYLHSTQNATTYYRTLATLTTSWQLVTLVTPALSALNWFFAVGVDLRDAGQASKLAQTIYMWGGQFELGAFPTSYIPTTAAAVTRAAEMCTMPTAGWLNALTCSLAAEYMMPQSPNTSAIGRDVCCISDGTAANRLTLRGLTASIATTLFSTSIASTTTISGSVGTVAASAITKIAAAWNGTIANGSLNAAAPVSYGVGLPAGLTTMAIGNDYSGAALYLNGWVRRVTYWPRALSNAELQQVTT